MNPTGLNHKDWISRLSIGAGQMRFACGHVWLPERSGSPIFGCSLAVAAISTGSRFLQGLISSIPQIILIGITFQLSGKLSACG
jgi:hypothetical protein